MSNSDHFSGDVLPTTDPSVEALSVNRKMFLGFLVKRLGNVTEAEDVLQEFCIRVMQHKDQLRETDKLTAWLYAVLRSTLNDHYRKVGRGRRLSVAFENEQKTAEVGAEEFTHICECVNGLMPTIRPDQSDLIRRVDIEDEDRQSVANDLGVSVVALAVRLHRARAALRDSLLDHCCGCCKDGFSDCSCPTGGCQNKATQSSC